MAYRDPELVTLRRLLDVAREELAATEAAPHRFRPEFTDWMQATEASWADALGVPVWRPAASGNVVPLRGGVMPA